MTHLFLATMYSMLLLSPMPQESWTTSKVTLIHKANATDDPSDFRMIALTAAVAEIYHQIMADRRATYLLDNHLLDPLRQKAFLRGINGCIEHTQVNSKTVHMIFFGLADAFGSVSHDLIYLTLHRNSSTPEIISYIKNLYRNFSAYVQGPTWTSETDSARVSFKETPCPRSSLSLCSIS